MEGQEGGSSTPSYNEAIYNRFKKPPGIEDGVLRGRKQENRSSMGKEDSQEEVKREKKTGENQNDDTRNWSGPCKPRETITTRVVLIDPALQAHREHMATYAVICKFMELWPTEKALHV